ncbi:MAG: restriction endonuclease subunit S [Nitrosomonas sp.]|nr:restriction endonuclease subunit S [Nitrosomonas sp.]
MSEWRECQLGEIAEIQTGPFGSQLKNEQYITGGTPVVTVEHISNFRINNFSYPSVTDEDKNRLSKYLLNEGDIIFTRVGSVDLSAFVKPHQQGWMFSSRMLRVRPDEKVDARFLSYFFQQKPFRDYVLSIAVGATMPSINTEILKSLPVSYPELSEQKAIASVLSSLDDKIDLLHRQNKTLEAMAETLFRQWFVEEVGEDWEVGKLGDELDFTMGQSPLGISFNEDGIGVPMFQGNADFEFRFPKERVYTTEPTRFAQRFDTLISVRVPVGAQNMARKECCIGRGVAAFRYKNNNNYYTYTYFKLRSLMEEIKKFNDEGTVFGSISKSDFDALETIIPSSELIVEFEKEAKPINDKVIENCAQIHTLETLRDTLLPKLMSGEVRVTV